MSKQPVRLYSREMHVLRTHRSVGIGQDRRELLPAENRDRLCNNQGTDTTFDQRRRGWRRSKKGGIDYANCSKLLKVV